MTDSGEKINYSIRPAKCVERKIICDLVSKVSTNTPIKDYRYIGFGSFYFSDFVLFHQQLDITNMISIEKSDNTERYEYNRPYNCIDLKFCDAQEALSNEIVFSETEKNFIWLDYDSAFSKNHMHDIMTATQKISIGSYLFVSFNRSILPEEERLQSLKDEYGDYLPNVKETEIDYETLPSILYHVISNAINKTLMERNLGLDDKIKALSIFFIKYRDGAPMITIGYYFTNVTDTDTITRVEDLSLPGVTIKDEPFDLKVPCFTRAEIRELNRFLPGTDIDEICDKLKYLKKKDIQAYISLYKYYPNYFDTPYYT